MFNRKLIAVLAVCCGIWGGAARAAVAEDTFLLRNAGDLAALCSANQADPLYTAAINFCQGFTVGAFRVLQATVAAQPPPHLFCLKDPLPTRSQAIADLVQWINADPKHAALGAADSLAAFIAEREPCPRGK
jgi:hypothetical protein